MYSRDIFFIIGNTKFRVNDKTNLYFCNSVRLNQQQGIIFSLTSVKIQIPLFNKRLLLEMPLSHVLYKPSTRIPSIIFR